MAERYAAVALEREAGAVATAGPGDRNATLNRAALCLGELVAGGMLEAQTVRERLLAAAQAAGLPEREALATIASGMRAGLEQPRRAPERGDDQRRTSRPLPRASDEQHTRPPRAGVETLWQASRQVGETVADPPLSYVRASAYLLHRGFISSDLRLLRELDLARVLPDPDEHTYPSWWPASWARTWALAVLGFEADGQVGSIHARAIEALPDGAPKTRWPLGCLARGLMFADPRGRALLRGEPVAGTAAVLIVEGATDLLSAVCWLGREHIPAAVLAVTAGSASALGKIHWPEGITARVGTDSDETGDRYARAIRQALPASMAVERCRLPIEIS